jgi:hypothetical protein
MKQRFVLFSALILLGCAFLLFTGCPVDGTDLAGDAAARSVLADPSGRPVSLTLHPGDTAYYDLATGLPVPVTGHWDFGVEYQSGSLQYKDSGLVFFYTKSGDSGLGDGAVWFTDEEDYDEVESADDAVTDFSGTYAEYAPYVNDVNRWAYGMGGDRYEVPMNMMTYFGFPGGDGLTYGTAFTVNPYDPDDPEHYVFYDFDKKAAYTDEGGMPPDFAPTNQVYIIRHGDGEVYSKLQVTEFSLDPDDLFYDITFQFDEVDPPKSGR